MDFFIAFFRSVRARQAALDCVKKTIHDISMISRPKMVLVTDTPSLVKDIVPILEEFAEVIISFISMINIFFSKPF